MSFSSRLSKSVHPILALGIVLNVVLSLYRLVSLERRSSLADSFQLDGIATVNYQEDPLQSLDICNAKVVYHVGWDKPFGRTNNQLVAILHALDMAFDENGEMVWNGSNTTSIVAISGWAMETMSLFLSPDPGQDFNWTQNQLEHNGEALEENLPIIQYKQIKNLGLDEESEVVHLEAGDSYYYSKKNLQSLSLARIARRRKMILRKLISIMPKKQFQRFDMLTTYLKEQGLGGKYVTVHLRSLDGQCGQRVGRRLPSDECTMNPAYIKRLLEPHYTNVSQVPIVVIHDNKSNLYLRYLMQDPAIGPNIIVPAHPSWNFSVPKASSVVQDMMIAARSEFFIGPRVSSMSVMIGMMRVAMGANPDTNLVYVRERKPFLFNASWEVCGECIFFCNSKVHSRMCGASPIYA